jgi:cell division protein FtsB
VARGRRPEQARPDKARPDKARPVQARPEAVRTPRVAGRPPRVPAPPRGLSRRAAVMAVLLLVVATAMSPFVRALVAQQSRIAALETDVGEREQRVDDLESELARWDDPAFVVAQARQRFTYVMPGEVGYVVLEDPTATSPEEDPSGAAAEQVSGSDASWFGTLWDSVELAGEAPDDAVEPVGDLLDPPATEPVPAPGVTGQP